MNYFVRSTPVHQFNDMRQMYSLTSDNNDPKIVAKFQFKDDAEAFVDMKNVQNAIVKM